MKDLTLNSLNKFAKRGAMLARVLVVTMQCVTNARLTQNTEICIVKVMKTTLDINDSLLATAKAIAAQQRTTLTRLIEEGLQLRLRSPHASPKTSKRKIPVFKGRGGLVAGLNPLSNKSMLDAADDDA